MKKNQRVIAGIAAIVVGVAIIVAAVLTGSGQNNTSEPLADDDAGKVCPLSEVEGVITVSYGGVENITALATLRELCDVKTQSSDYGDFVTTIDGKDAGTENFWAFYVNDVMAEVGAGSYIAKDGDKIKWELTKIENNY